jgi:hypothetical protein
VAAVSRNKDKGTAFETLLLEPAAAYYDHVSRRPLAGAKDVGDLLLVPERRFVVEAKHHAALNLAGWAREAEVEADNAGVPFWVIAHKRVGKGRGADQWLTTTWGQFLALVHRSRS